MSRQRVTLAAIGYLVALGCGPQRAPAIDQSTGGGPMAGAAGALPGLSGEGGARTGLGGGAGIDQAGAQGGTSQAGAPGAGTGGTIVPPEAVCGNDLAEAGEACDGDDLSVWDCAAAGFETGDLVCRDDCTLDLSGCEGDERCTDGRDNDGDQAVDCDDDDCEESCSDPCAAPIELADPATVTGNTVGHAAVMAPSCRWNDDPTGPEVAYVFTAANTGTFSASVSASAALSVAVYTECGADSSELRCAYGERIELPVEEGEVLYVVVDGMGEADAGRYTLMAASRSIVCGDAFRDGDEGCDDGNTSGGDGCSATCEVESSEGEDNDTLETADAMPDDYRAAIDPIGDEDWIELRVAASQTSLVARTLDFGDGACVLERLDSVVELFDEEGVVLADDDDGGAGYCSEILFPDLSPGTYYLRVTASSYGTVGAFPYVLHVDLDVCGNGRTSDAEECDDGNRTEWDGCDAECRVE
ncbi:MAG: DVUA0089 family protein [Polyangiaceae bacterium]|nr:DVUA0089 family protein [Polyangiaceae bacterium]